MTTITGKEAFEFIDELNDAWVELELAFSNIQKATQTIDRINDVCENTKRRDAIREDYASIDRACYDLQAEAWVLCMNLYASFGLDSQIPDCEAKRRWERDQRGAKRRERLEKQIAGSTVVELTAEQLKQGIKEGWL